MSVREIPAGIAHGGDLDRARRRHGGAPESWLDLSTGISPFAYPDLGVSRAGMARLPDAAAQRALLAAARACYGVPDAAALAAGAGAQALIQMLPHCVEPGRRVAIAGPTYGEHARCWAMAGHFVTETAPGRAPAAADILVCVRPNNPTGTLADADWCLEQAARLARQGGLMVVDEAFCDTLPAASLARAAGRPGLLLLRSFGKFFGLAGIRLGFAIGAPAPIARLEAALGPWAVSGPALEIGTRALRDESWIGAARARLAAAAQHLEALLTARGLAVAGGTDLFRLALAEDAAALHAALAERRIWTRIFDADPAWIRFGLPPDPAGFERLDRALAGFAGTGPARGPLPRGGART